MSTREHTSGLVVLAVDDEVAGLDETKYLLESNPRVGRVISVFDAAEALRVLRGDDPELARRVAEDLPPVDVVFADVSMPGLSGMELARVLSAFRRPPALVFITGHEENALEAFEVGAIDYIMKPADTERVDRALRAVERDARVNAAVEPGTQQEALTSSDPGEDDEVIPVELAGTTKLVPRRSVRWVEAQGDYARLHTAEGSHLVRIPLAQLEERWGDAGFLRIHRSYLVSLAQVTELRMSSSGYSVVLGDPEEELPVSRRHTRELKDRLVRAPRQGWE
ncbi:LytTR family DNA-binding domain-containing protein [Salinifilum aidingensis]